MKKTNLNSGGAADYLCLAKSTLANMRVSGTGPIYASFGRKVVYQVSDLDAWQNARKVSSTSDITLKEANRNG